MIQDMPIRTVTKEWLEDLPDEVRERLHVRVGDKVEYVIQEDGKIVLRPAVLSARSAFGVLNRPGMEPASIEEMNESAGKFLAEEDERIEKGRK
jgi:antitoxin PrlF